MDDEEEYDDREKLFHSTVREYIVSNCGIVIEI